MIPFDPLSGFLFSRNGNNLIVGESKLFTCWFLVQGCVDVGVAPSSVNKSRWLAGIDVVRILE